MPSNGPSELSDWKWLDKPEQWDAVVKACYAKGVVGLDTETYGHNVKTSTPAHRAKVDVWSLALSTSQLHPRGYHVARACVLPLEAALYPPMKEMLESRHVLHVFHNANHDQHAFANHGIEVGLVFDTLHAVRLLWPGMDEGYYLKPLRVNLLGKPAREGFKGKKRSKHHDAEPGLTDPLQVTYTVFKEVKECACGIDGCRLTEKKWGPGHRKTLMKEEIEKTRMEPCPIESIVPGHVRWDRKRAYAGDDSADGLELYELVLLRIAELEPKLPELPWELPGEAPVVQQQLAETGEGSL